MRLIVKDFVRKGSIQKYSKLNFAWLMLLYTKVIEKMDFFGFSKNKILFISSPLRLNYIFSNQRIKLEWIISL